MGSRRTRRTAGTLQGDASCVRAEKARLLPRREKRALAQRCPRLPQRSEQSHGSARGLSLAPPPGRAKSGRPPRVGRQAGGDGTAHIGSDSLHDMSGPYLRPPRSPHARRRRRRRRSQPCDGGFAPLPGHRVQRKRVVAEREEAMGRACATMLHVVRCRLHIVRCRLHVVCCRLHVVCCTLCVACCPLHVVRSFSIGPFALHSSGWRYHAMAMRCHSSSAAMHRAPPPPYRA